MHKYGVKKPQEPEDNFDKIISKRKHGMYENSSESSESKQKNNDSVKDSDQPFQIAAESPEPLYPNQNSI
jgi:hypothetical protein